MTKAIVQVEMPARCCKGKPFTVECELVYLDKQRAKRCYATGLLVGDYFNSRHPECPLVEMTGKGENL